MLCRRLHSSQISADETVRSCTEKTECLKWKAVKWFSRDIRQIEQAMCRDKNSPFDQIASPFYLRYNKQAALTSISLNTFGPTGERWGASVKHCSPYHASSKSSDRDERMQIQQVILPCSMWTVDSSLIEFCCEYMQALSVYLLFGVLSLSIIKLT